MSHEIEFKRLLADEASWSRVAEALEALHLERTAPRMQRNHFFDSKDRKLRNAGFALRVRLEDESALLTAKGPPEDGVSLARAQVLREVEAPLSLDRARELLAERDSPLEELANKSTGERALLESMARALDGAALGCVGHFENQRTVFGPKALASGDKVHIEMDRTRFGDRVDYELEVEVTAESAREVEEFLDDVFAQLSLTWTPAPSKAARLFELNA